MQICTTLHTHTHNTDKQNMPEVFKMKKKTAGSGIMHNGSFWNDAFLTFNLINMPSILSFSYWQTKQKLKCQFFFSNIHYLGDK